MKTIIVLFCLCLTISSYSQVDYINGYGEGNVKMSELPEVVIKGVGNDFSVYLPDKNPNSSQKALEEKFIAYRLGKDYQGYDNYLIIMEVDKGSLVATYNKNGKLIGVVEKYKNIKPPTGVIRAIYEKYPGWEIVSGKYTYSQEDGKIKDKNYKIKIRKDNEVRKILIHSDGAIAEAF